MDKNMNQREMPFFRLLTQAKWVDISIVASWSSYREAVIWCWANRPRHDGVVETLDQAICAQELGCHPPHFSRFVNEKTKSPMNMNPDYITRFEAYTGWRGVSQYMAKISQVTILEEIQASRKAA